MSNVPMNTVYSLEPRNHEELSYYLLLIISFSNYGFIVSSDILVKNTLVLGPRMSESTEPLPVWSLTAPSSLSHWPDEVSTGNSVSPESRTDERKGVGETASWLETGMKEWTGAKLPLMIFKRINPSKCPRQQISASTDEQ